MPHKSQQIAFAWLAALGMTLVGVWPAALWADCCCTGRAAEALGPTGSCCCQATATPQEDQSCCASTVEVATAATECDSGLDRQDCQCDDCDCQLVAAPPPIAESRSTSSSVEAPVAILAFTIPLLESSITSVLLHPPEVAAQSRPLREWFCVWLI